MRNAVESEPQSSFSLYGAAKPETWYCVCALENGDILLTVDVQRRSGNYVGSINTDADGQIVEMTVHGNTFSLGGLPRKSFWKRFWQALL